MTANDEYVVIGLLRSINTESYKVEKIIWDHGPTFTLLSRFSPKGGRMKTVCTFRMEGILIERRSIAIGYFEA